MNKQQWYEMTENEVIKVLESVVNWVEYNKVTTFSEYGMQGCTGCLDKRGKEL